MLAWWLMPSIFSRCLHEDTFRLRRANYERFRPMGLSFTRWPGHWLALAAIFLAQSVNNILFTRFSGEAFFKHILFVSIAPSFLLARRKRFISPRFVTRWFPADDDYFLFKYSPLITTLFSDTLRLLELTIAYRLFIDAYFSTLRCSRWFTLLSLSLRQVLRDFWYIMFSWWHAAALTASYIFLT